MICILNLKKIEYLNEVSVLKLQPRQIASVWEVKQKLHIKDDTASSPVATQKQLLGLHCSYQYKYEWCVCVCVCLLSTGAWSSSSVGWTATLWTICPHRSSFHPPLCCPCQQQSLMHPQPRRGMQLSLRYDVTSITASRTSYDLIHPFWVIEIVKVVGFVKLAGCWR